jgi:hypothetical protein
MLMTSTSAGGPVDPSFASVVMLAHFDGANGSSTFTNSCPRGNTPTVSGSATLSTAQQLYGTASISLNGTTQSIVNASHADYAFGTSDWTIELAARFGSVAGIQALFDMRPNGTNGAYPLIYQSGGAIVYYVNSSALITSGVVLSTGVWHRIAVSHISGNTRMYVDGTAVAANIADATTYLQSAMWVGTNQSAPGNNWMNAFVDEYRVTNGVGRYSGASYTPDAAAFPDS